MKSSFSLIRSSVIPISRSSSSRPFQEGSAVSKGAAFCGGLAGGRGAVGGGGGVLVVAARGCSRLLNRERPVNLPLGRETEACRLFDAKGVWRVSLLAFFSRSIIFLMNVFASLSSEKESPAEHSSSSKVWKKVRS